MSSDKTPVCVLKSDWPGPGEPTAPEDSAEPKEREETTLGQQEGKSEQRGVCGRPHLHSD